MAYTLRLALFPGCLLALASLTDWGSPIWGEEPVRRPVTSGIDPTQVDEWVARLTSPRAAERHAAAEQLLAAGPRVLPYLPTVSEDTDPALSAALGPLRRELQQQLARETVAASKVTLKGSFKLSKLLGLVAEQTGNVVPIEEHAPGLADEIVAVDWDKVAFWQVLGDLERRLKLELSSDEDRAWKLRRLAGDLPPTVTHGPFRVRWVKPQFRDLREVGPARRLLRGEVQLQVEPRLTPLFAILKAREWGAMRGNETWDPWNPKAVYELSFDDGGHQVQVPVDYVVTDGPLNHWSLSGQATVQLAAGREAVRFAGRTLERGRVEERGAVQVTLRRVRWSEAAPSDGARKEDGAGRELAISLTLSFRQGGPAFESYRLAFFYRAAWIVDRDGQRIEPAGVETTLESDGELAVNYVFRGLKGGPLDCAFVFEAPSLLLAVPARFELTDLPPP